MAWSTTRPNLPTQKPSWWWRNISLFTFLAGRTTEQVLDKGIETKIHKKNGLHRCLQCLLSGVSQAWPAGLRENGMSAKVRVRISRIMPQNVYTRPPFTVYSFACINVNRREVVKSGSVPSVCQYMSLAGWGGGGGAKFQLILFVPFVRK